FFAEVGLAVSSLSFLTMLMLLHTRSLALMLWQLPHHTPARRKAILLISDAAHSSPARMHPAGNARLGRLTVANRAEINFAQGDHFGRRAADENFVRKVELIPRDRFL